MVSSITGTQSSGILGGLAGAQTTPSASTTSFTDQLAATLEAYLAQAGNGSNLEIDIQATQSQDSGARQFLVTVKNPSGTPGQAAASAAPASASVSTPQTPADISASSPSGASSPSASTPKSPTDLLRSEEDAYWAAQPPEVQQLRTIGDYNARLSLAGDLAAKGYTIDRGIMVNGWDPLKTMTARQIYGYTWTPSFNQSVNSAPPGMALSPETAYDPSNPPTGSIKVSTAFADGMGIKDVFAL